MVGNSRRARASRKRQWRMKRVDHDLDPAQWSALVDAWNGCAYCGATDRAMQKDCVMALSRGGRYTLDNIVPACRSCNASKCNAEVTSWMRRKRLDEQRFLVRFHEISTALQAGADLTNILDDDDEPEAALDEQSDGRSADADRQPAP